MTSIRTSLALGLALCLTGRAWAQQVSPDISDRDFMFIYPTIFGPAIEFHDKTYGTGFGVDEAVAGPLKTNEIAALRLDSYGVKQFWGNVVFYPGLGLSYSGIGLPVMLLANTISGSAYEDLSRAVAAYNGPSPGKVTFDLRQFGYKLRVNDETFERNDAKLLGILGARSEVEALVDSYRSKNRTATILGWGSLAGPAIGLALVGATSGAGGGGYFGGPALGGLFLGIGFAGACVATWIISNFVGASAEADLVEAVKLYNEAY